MARSYVLAQPRPGSGGEAAFAAVDAEASFFGGAEDPCGLFVAGGEGAVGLGEGEQLIDRLLGAGQGAFGEALETERPVPQRRQVRKSTSGMDQRLADSVVRATPR